MECPTCGKMCASEKGMKQHHSRSHGTSLNITIVDCDRCGESFEKNKHELKKVSNSFCSDECENGWRSELYSGENHHNHKQKVNLECEYCGEAYTEYPYRADKSRFCSQECSGKYKTQQGTTEVTCDWCECEFTKHNKAINRTNHNFCSESCYGSWNSENRNAQDHPNWTGGANLYEAIRENLSDEPWSTVATESKSSSCYMCGIDDEPLHEHHIIPVMYGGVNSEELLMTLCPSCHRTVEAYTMNMLDTNIVEVV